MDLELEQIPEAPEQIEYRIPWKPIDNWVGILLLAVINVSLLLIASSDDLRSYVENAGLIVLQLSYLLPLVVIFAYRRINIKVIGFGPFDWNTLAMGCGLLIGAYMIIIFHNLILAGLGYYTQGQEVLKLLDELESPGWFILVGVVLAPVVEETFFRGFLFQGFRARYGWVRGGILSAIIFGAAHLDPAAFIPTSILGLVLAYMYHRSNSIWPGVILHFLVNAFGFCSILVLTRLQDFIPV